VSPTLNLDTYAPPRDGQRFLVNVSGYVVPRLHLVTNWRRLLKKPEG
jgi:hypothetical protein